MKDILSKKRIVFLTVIVLLIIVTGLYTSYAINVYYNEDTPTTYDQALGFSLSGVLETELVVEANKTKVLDLDITNPYEGSIKYGLTYKMINPTTLPEGVTIAQSSESNSPTVGLIGEDEKVIVSVIIVNNTDSNLTFSLGLVHGYENGGEMILEDGEVLIEEEYQVGPPPQGYKLILDMIANRNTDTPDFTKTSCSSGCEEATVGLYEYQDDLGTSYYFRGDVENNYVKFGKWNDDAPDYYCGVLPEYGNECDEFYETEEECLSELEYYDGSVCRKISRAGKDMYWRIIRINGDGTVRMIYDGTQAWENGVSNANRQIGTSAFNSSYNDNAYVGYMFGQTGVTATGTTGYNATHSNDNNSTIKTYLEGELNSNNTGWYYNNIIATGYHQYVADAIYCNDRSLGSEGTGIGGTTNTVYGAYERLYRNFATNVNPQLTCTNKNDRFTISTSTLAPIDGLGTNQKLKYPVGLITADEVVLAGGKVGGAMNESYYLYNGQWYWTMAPSDFDGIAGAFIVDSSGQLSGVDVDNSPFGVRAVLSLNSDALKFGDGTIGNEFRITE